jgi:hypothetical protein
MDDLISQEVKTRVENPEEYKKNVDYLQSVLNTVGDKYAPG